MYSLKAYGEMIKDPVRMEPYVRALRDAVRPGAVVLDLGCGTGIFAMLACRFGARRVFAIEPDDAIQVAREAAAANGLGASIEFLQAMSTQVSLPEPADVIISDLRGVLPLLQHHIPSIVDARRRHLAPGGRMIPLGDRLWVACVEAPDLHRGVTSPWIDCPYGLDLGAGRAYRCNHWSKAHLKPEQFLTAARNCGSLDYATIDDPDFVAEVALEVARPGLGHGLGIWFDATLAEGIGFSNAPGLPEAIYGQAFFPWPEPLPLAEGDTVKLELRATLVDGEYTWTWHTSVLDGAVPGAVKALHRQSTFLAAPIPKGSLRRQADSHVPVLNEDGEIDAHILRRMGEQAPLGDIARELAARHPARFPRWEAALTRVGGLSTKYSR